jgi:hypothetical protein
MNSEFTILLSKNKIFSGCLLKRFIRSLNILENLTSRRKQLEMKT